MRETPPPSLIDQLQRLQLANSQQVRGMYSRVRRLARDLPLFESVWVDALAQARILTPFQAAQLNAGRGDALRVGPYVLCQSLTASGYVATYLARKPKSPQLVRLAVAEVSEDQRSVLARQLEQLVAHGRRLDSAHLAPVIQAGVDGTRLWASSRHVVGRTAGQWIAHNGRFPPHAVLEIARQMLAGLVLVEKAGFCHGDLSAWNVILTDDGQVVLPEPGLRGIVRPEEGYAHTDLLPEFYDYLAPERIIDGTPPTTASDVYALGCVWWHLLAGRPPVPGGNSLAKLRAVHSGQILDVRRLAPDTPSLLARTVTACLQRASNQRPESMRRLASMLGETSPKGRRTLTRSVTRPGRRRTSWTVSLASLRDSKPTGLWLTASIASLLAALILAWSMWPRGNAPAPAKAMAKITAAIPEKTGVKESERTGSRPPPSPEPKEEGVMDIASSADKPLKLDSLQLRPGQRVCGTPGKRLLVAVPTEGLVIATEDLRFEHIDFVWNTSDPPASPATSPAILQLRASRATFHGCSFQSAGHGLTQPTAIRWSHLDGYAASAIALPTGQVQLSDCVFRHVGVGIESQRVGAVAVEMANVLHLGSGPLVHLNHCPKLDEPVVVSLASVTLRDSGPLLQCVYEQLEDQPGSITVQANGSAFVTGPQVALLSFVGPAAPEQLLTSIQWTGQGSLVAPQTVVAQWRHPDGKPQSLDDTSVSIAGLVRSSVDFAGPAETGPEANRITRWQVPLHSSSPPGIDPASLDWRREQKDKDEERRTKGTGPHDDD